MTIAAIVLTACSAVITAANAIMVRFWLRERRRLGWHDSIVNPLELWQRKVAEAEQRRRS